MNGIAAKIAIEILMLLQNDHLHTRARQKKAEHHARRSAPRHHAMCAKRFCVTHSEPIRSRPAAGKRRILFFNGYNRRRDVGRRVRGADQRRFATKNRRTKIEMPARTSADRRRLLARDGTEAEEGNVTSPLSCMMA